MGTLPISGSGYTINQIKGVTVKPSDGSVYFASLTAIYKKGASWGSSVERLAGDHQSSGYVDSVLGQSRFAGLEVSYL
mgnify:FL=1